MHALILDAHMRGPHLIGVVIGVIVVALVIAALIKYVFFK
jgi:hypothetical protein